MSGARDYTTFATPLPHPGEHLREDFLPQYHLTAGALAKAMKLEDRTRIERLVREAQPVAPDTALRLGRVFGTSADLWMGLQTAHDLSKAAIAKRDAVLAIDALYPMPNPAIVVDGEPLPGLNEDSPDTADGYVVRVETVDTAATLVIGRHLDMDEARELIENNIALQSEGMPSVAEGVYPEGVHADPHGASVTVKMLASAGSKGFCLPWRRWLYRVEPEP